MQVASHQCQKPHNNRRENTKMPGYNLEIKEQSVSGMKATEPSDKMNVTGTLEIKVANNGLVPTFTLLQISEFKIENM